MTRHNYILPEIEGEIRFTGKVRNQIRTDEDQKEGNLCHGREGITIAVQPVDFREKSVSPLSDFTLGLQFKEITCSLTYV